LTRSGERPVRSALRLGLLALAVVAVAAGAPAARAAQRAPTGEVSIVVYFSHRERSADDFGAVFPVARTAMLPRIATAALDSAIAGPTPDEQAEGYFSELGGMLAGESTCGGPDFTLGINAGLAVVRFCRLVTSAGVGQDARARSQLEATLLQFPTVQRVRLLTSDGQCLFDASGLNLCLR
jgi:hypothetical protein